MIFMCNGNIFHNWDKWEDVGACQTWVHSGGAIIQAKVCRDCGKRVLRKTNSVFATEVYEAKEIISSWLKQNEKAFPR